MTEIAGIPPQKAKTGLSGDPGIARNRRNRKTWQRARLARRAACIRRQKMIAYVEVLSGLERSDKEK
jgi:hypothetical protein